jgi:hypothetical protein
MGSNDESSSETTTKCFNKSDKCNWSFNEFEGYKLNENGSNMFVLFSNKAWVMICEFLRVWVCCQPKGQFDPEFSPLYCIEK